ncbi:MAG: diguanylate cyclase [Elusimicrobiales bacterium]
MQGILILAALLLAGLAYAAGRFKRLHAGQLAREKLSREALDKFVIALYKRDMETGLFEYLSPGFTTISGYAAEELPFQTYLELIHPSDRPEAERAFGKAPDGAAGGACQLQYRFRHRNGQYLWLHDQFVIMRGAGGKPETAVGAVADISVSRQADIYREIRVEILRILYGPGALQDTVRRVIEMIKAGAEADAVGVRLRDGDDFPYFAQDGFSKEFLSAENALLERGEHGRSCRDTDGNVCLKCACGLVISGNTDASRPLFTKGGSCWTNDSPALLGGDERNRCAVDGYCSVALIPIRANDRIAGLLQLNARRKGCFSLYSVTQLESIAAYIGEALLRKRAEKAREESRDHLHLLSITDDLTGLNNRRGFLEVARSQFNTAKRYGKPLTLLFCDIDGFKRINDVLGHDAGDKAIKDVAHVLTQTLRTSDVAARIGGDEFVVLLPQSGAAAARGARARVQSALKEINLRRKFPINMSIGICEMNVDSMRAVDDMLALADADMYRQKKQRRPQR